MDKIRIQKFFSECGIMSRRAAEEEIVSGKIKINGQTAKLGDTVDPIGDTIEYNGTIIRPKQLEQKTYIMLNKPRGYLSSVSDDRGRKCVTELVSNSKTRVYPVGRLDMDSEGLLLLTNDGELTFKLTHPKHEFPKIYNVTLFGEIPDDQLQLLHNPIEINGRKTAPIGLKIIARKNNKTIIEITLHEGRNRQIRRLCEAAGLKLTRLFRVAIGDLKLDVPVGKWRFLTCAEVDYLYGNITKDQKQQRKS